MNKTSTKQTITTYICQECQKEKPALGFTSLNFGHGKPAKNLCQACYNIYAAKQRGVPAPNPSEFSPITLFDSIGKKHTFSFQMRFSTGLGIIASEINDEGEPHGYEFSVLKHPNSSALEAYTALIEKIKKGLSVRYLCSSDFGEYSSLNKLYIKDNAIVGRIEENKNGPTVVIDGKEYTWEELGQFLAPFSGFNFRLECMDSAEEIDISSKVERPNVAWWLKKTPVNEAKKEIH